MRDLDTTARDILRTNDRGGFTVPTARLYPYQWNWDSAFAALGFAEFDLDRAWRELETLMEGQWPNGMVPHIIFRRDDPDYFPGPPVWDTGRDPPTSGHSQPPVLATVLRSLYERDRQAGASRAKALLPGVLAWHRWMHSDRDPNGTGEIVTTHPWEAGRDNSPDWDRAMEAIDPSSIEPYTRRDTGHIEASMRPTKDDYDRYLSLIAHGRKVRWDTAEIARSGPFAVVDPGLTFMLARADRDLKTVAEALGEDRIAAEIDPWIKQAAGAAEAMWSSEVGAYVARDTRSGVRAEAASSVAFLAFYAGQSNAARDGVLMDTLRRFLAAQPNSVPSFDPDHPNFDALRYWRGPVWAIVNMMIAQGLDEAGATEEAGRIRADTRRLIEQAGFFEYYDPRTGAGAGGRDFTWTAAVWLAWASPSKG